MSTPLHKYHVHLFINGSQVGGNATFAEWYPSDAAAVRDARAFFTAEGYHVESVNAAEGEVRPASPLAPATHGRILTVRLSTQP